jgi:hypothetical protein
MKKKLSNIVMVGLECLAGALIWSAYMALAFAIVLLRRAVRSRRMAMLSID